MELEREIADMIVNRLDLEDVDIEQIDYDAPLFASYDDESIGLMLDSVDALELVVGLSELYNVKVSDEEMAIFRSISTIADFVREKQQEQ